MNVKLALQKCEKNISAEIRCAKIQFQQRYRAETIWCWKYAKKTLTNRTIYDIVDGRMEEPRSFFYAQIPNEGGQKRDPNIKNF